MAVQREANGGPARQAPPKGCNADPNPFTSGPGQ